jgi:hypothetical protein
MTPRPERNLLIIILMFAGAAVWLSAMVLFLTAILLLHLRPQEACKPVPATLVAPTPTERPPGAL